MNDILKIDKLYYKNKYDSGRIVREVQGVSSSM
jgi:hypothetical protein